MAIVDSGLGWAVKEEFYKQTHGNLCTLSGRTFYTQLDGPIVYATVYKGDYTGPVVLSTNINLVAYQPGEIVSQGSFMYLGVKWYITNFGYWMQGNCTDSSGLSQKLTITDATNYTDMGIAILRAAGVTPSEYAQTSTTKVYYNGKSKVIKRLCQIINSVARLGITHDTAFYGDQGQAAWEHSQTIGNPHNLTLEDLGIENINRRIDLLMEAVGSWDNWIDHADNEFFIDHENDEELIFNTGAELLKLH